MPIGFYGFDFGGYPSTSRLFNPQVMNRAQQAYNTGMSQFQQFDPNQIAQTPQPVEPQQPTLDSLFRDNRHLGLGGNARAIKRDDGYMLSTIGGGGGQKITGRQLRIDDRGNLLDTSIDKLGDAEFNAYNRLLAMLRGGM